MWKILSIAFVLLVIFAMPSGVVKADVCPTTEDWFCDWLAGDIRELEISSPGYVVVAIWYGGQVIEKDGIYELAGYPVITITGIGTETAVLVAEGTIREFGCKSILAPTATATMSPTATAVPSNTIAPIVTETSTATATSTSAPVIETSTATATSTSAPVIETLSEPKPIIFVVIGLSLAILAIIIIAVVARKKH